nr:hypothetical protein BaRGS_026591 [Batillaria attramentaria]
MVFRTHFSSSMFTVSRTRPRTNRILVLQEASVPKKEGSANWRPQAKAVIDKVILRDTAEGARVATPMIDLRGSIITIIIMM